MEEIFSKKEASSIPENWKYISDIIKTKSETNNLHIYTVTWNIKGNLPSEEDVEMLLPKDKHYDMYIIGTQECMRSILSSFFFSNKDPWVTMLK